ncbi:MAG: aspartate dehydrogenase [Beijerinckiaceae bacterium]|nr:aspartate dehydrogenase [Beijerinckiaceae bacterium]
MKLGLIGHGAVARQALAAIAEHIDAPLEALVVLARADSAHKARDMLARWQDRVYGELVIVSDIEGLIEHRPSIVAEAAGHQAVGAFGPALVGAGIDFLMTSAGALASAPLRAALDESARAGQARWEICSGAVGGLDILAAARLSGLDDVLYTSRKPPLAWRGTPAEALINLESLAQAITFYEGSAEAAARDYPQNANVAATIAIMGAGFERTRVRLVADPVATRNTHEVSFRSGCADVDIRIAGKPSPDNPKTSLTTGYALAARLLQMTKHAQ